MAINGVYSNDYNYGNFGFNNVQGNFNITNGQHNPFGIFGQQNQQANFSENEYYADEQFPPSTEIQAEIDKMSTEIGKMVEFLDNAKSGMEQAQNAGDTNKYNEIKADYDKVMQDYTKIQADKAQAEQDLQDALEYEGGQGVQSYGGKTGVSTHEFKY